MPTCKIFWIAFAPARSRIARSISGIASPSLAGCPWIATGAGAPCAGTPRRNRSSEFPKKYGDAPGWLLQVVQPTESRRRVPIFFHGGTRRCGILQYADRQRLARVL